MGATLGGRLRESFREYQRRPAVHAGDRLLTYGELGRRAEAVAAALAAHGIGRGHRVGLWMEKSFDGLAALLGTLLSGAAYVPIDVKAPPLRSLGLAADAELSALVIDELRRPQLGAAVRALPGLRLLLHAAGGPPGAGVPADPDAAGLPSLPIAELPATGGAAPGPEPAPAESAYILYTSGSTGRPKGVEISHRAALGFVDWCLRTLQPGPDDRMVSHAPWHFDLSTFDLFVTFLCGGAVRLLTSTEAMLAPWIARSLAGWGTTVWYSVPWALTAMVEQGRLSRQLWPQARLVLFAGEPFPTPKLRQLQRALPQARLFNLFGPTETNVCTYYEVPPLADDETRPTPIGRACEHLEALILDEALGEVPPGTVGDLWIAGDNLFTGYWRDPELTAQRLRPDPRPGRAGQIYNTGDRVRLEENRGLAFHGRRDHLVKIRGYRVELGEVEAALHAVPGVAEAAAVAVPNGDGHRLIGFVCWRDGVQPDEAGLQAGLRERLPLYMIPPRWVRLERLPRTANGKVDRQHLAELAR